MTMTTSTLSAFWLATITRWERMAVAESNLQLPTHWESSSRAVLYLNGLHVIITIIYNEGESWRRFHTLER